MNAHELTLYLFIVIGVLLILLALVKAVKTDSWLPFFEKVFLILIAFFVGLMIAWLSVPDGTTWP